MAILGLTGAPIHKGSWGGLPDLGITERLQGVKSTTPTKAASAASPSSQRVYTKTPTPLAVNRGQVLGTNNTYTQQSGGSLPQSQPQPVNNEPTFDFGGGVEEPNRELELINEEFNNFNSYLDQQQSMAQSNFSDTQKLMDTQKANALSQYGTDKTQQTEAIKKNESLNLAKVRQLLQDLQQSNAARTAITGASGSAAEALGERFGRKAQEGMSNVMNTAEGALERVNTFYNQAVTKLNDNYNAQLLSAKQQLDENLNNIAYQRNQSATAKQQNMLSAWRNYYDNVNQAKLQAAQFKAQYDIWKQQNDNAYAAWGTQGNQVASDYNTGVAPSLQTSSYELAPGVTASNPYATNPTYKRYGTANEEEDQDYLNYNFNTANV